MTRGRGEEGKRGRGEEGKRGRGEEGKRDVPLIRVSRFYMHMCQEECKDCSMLSRVPSSLLRIHATCVFMSTFGLNTSACVSIEGSD
jgi:hypothetical protein